MLVEVRDTDIQKLSKLIREETGNQVAEKNHSMIVSRIRTHVLKLGLASMHEYWEYFTSHEVQEREVIRGLMTTHYTFFFREFIHFEALKDWIDLNSERLKARFAASQEPLRVWSAACSKGQEVYSLACFLELELKKRFGVPYTILGTDIDAASIQYARNGVYPLKEVNTIPAVYLSRFWKMGTGQVKDFAAAHPTLKERLAFETLNLLELESWQNSTKFDVVFCRNVFIYFSDENVKKIALGLSRKLDSHGLLVSGLSEPIRFSGWDFESVAPSCYMRKQNLNVDNLPNAKVIQFAQPFSALKPSFESGTKSGNYRVLCVDDSSTIQLLMKKIFSQDPKCSGVEFAGNGRQAKEMLDRAVYDLITLDIHMPEVNGIEFLEKLYDSKKHPPVLMISSVNRTDIELATRSISLGAFDYVEKPAMNRLETSSAEILTKAKMALRSRANSTAYERSSFDQEISTKIVVPDASMCLRLVSVDFLSDLSCQSAEWIVKGQSNEYRSPALLLVSKVPITADIEQRVLSWTDRPVTSIKFSRALLRPNAVYLVSADDFKLVLDGIRATSVSLQIAAPLFAFTGSWEEVVSKFSRKQVLLDEWLQSSRLSVETELGTPVSDISPATSFPSLSVEYFANLRKAA